MGGNLGRALISAKGGKMMKFKRRSDKLDLPQKLVNGEGEHPVTWAYEHYQALHYITPPEGMGLSIKC